MCRKCILLIFIVLLVGTVGSARAATLFHWTFDGTPDANIVSDTDVASGVTVTSFVDSGITPDDNLSLTYGDANPWYNAGGTSADFNNINATGPSDNDPGIGLYAQDVDNSMDLSLPAFTIEAFIKPRTLRQCVLVRKYGGGQYYIDIRASGDVQFSINDDDNAAVAGAGAIQADTWYHIAGVFDETDTKEPMKLYIDGELAGTAAFAAQPGDSSRGLGIGAIIRHNEATGDAGSTGQFYDGLIDEVRISDVALVPNQFLLYETGGSASRPRPRHRAQNICEGVSLCWKAGEFAAEHDVYMGTDWDDVNDANTTSSEYIGRQALDANCYTPSSLELGTTYYWRIDEVSGAITWKGGVWQFTTNDGKAYEPWPADEQTAVVVDQVLSWTPGCSTLSHDVYVGTSLSAVTNATTTSHHNVEYANVDVNSFDPAGDFDYFTTYYWRVDEVAESETRKGDIWQFRTRVFIEDPNFVAWYKLDETEDVNAYDSSGYEHHAYVDGPPNWDPEDGEYGGSLVFNDDTDVECPAAVLGKLNDQITISVWLKDAYRAGSDNLVFGAESGDYRLLAAVVESSDPEQVLWQAGDINDVVRWDLGGIDASELEGWHHWVFIKSENPNEISIYFDGELGDSNSVVSKTLVNLRDKQLRFGVGRGQSNTFIGKIDDAKVFDRALSAYEVKVLYRGGDLAQAWSPNPYGGQTGVPRDVILSWKPGDYAVSHDVYFGANFDDVNEGAGDTFKGNQALDANSYDPPGDLELGQTYYWRIDEVNDANDDSPWKGRVWRFTVANFLVVDDMESYDPSVNRIGDTWLDGWVNWTGSEVSLGSVAASPPSPVNGGDQSMIYAYDNGDSLGDGLEYYSEIERTFDTPQDWTEADVKILTLYFYGDPNNDANATEQMYVGLEDSSGEGSYAEVKYGYYNDEDMNDIKDNDWQEWNIGLADFAGVTLEQVKKVYIGLGIRGNLNPSGTPGGLGTVCFDDIRLYTPKCIASRLKPIGDLTDDCVVDLADVEVVAEQWLKGDVYLARQAPGDANLVGLWQFEEGAGSDVNDSSGNDYHGTAEGAYKWVAGQVGEHAIDFDGGMIVVPDEGNTPQLRPPNEVTVTAWIKVSEHLNRWRFIVMKGEDDEEPYGLELNTDNALSFIIRDAAGGLQAVDSEDVLLRNNWIHVAGTYDGNNLTSYVNGQVEVTKEVGSVTLYNDPNDALVIGGRWNDTGGRFADIMDDVRVYNKGLSAAEIAYFATDETGYSPLMSEANLHDKEAKGEKAINFRDYAALLENWLDKKLWPPAE